MGFSIITSETEWQDPQYINEPIAAYAERLSAWLGEESDIPPRAAGDDAQDGVVISSFQGWCEAYCVHCADTTYEDYEGLGGPSTQPTVYWTLATFREAAGIPEGFRRVPGPDWPEDWTDYEDPAFEYGAAQPGDIVGPWALEDPQLAFKKLVWIDDVFWNCVVSWDNKEEDNQGYGMSDDRDTLADAKADAETAFAVPTSNNGPPIALAEWAAPGLHYYVQIQRRYSYPYFEAGDDRVKAVDFYFYASASDEFDANGDPAEEDAWNLWSTKSLSGVSGYGDKFGDCAAVPNYAATTGHVRGYLQGNLGIGSGLCPIFKFDVPGGFVYY